MSGDDDGLDLDLPPVDSKLPQIPGLEKLPFNTSAFNPEEAERVFKEKCVQNGGEEAYRSAKVPLVFASLLLHNLLACYIKMSTSLFLL